MFEEYAKNDNDIMEEYLPILKALPALSYDTFGTIHKAILNVSDVGALKKKNLRQLAFKVGIKCDELLEICKYKDDEIACCDYFLPLYSEHGMCYSFNTRYYSTDSNE